MSTALFQRWRRVYHRLPLPYLLKALIRRLYHGVLGPGSVSYTHLTLPTTPYV